MPSDRSLKILTWNINGLRSFGGPEKWRKLFNELDSDILCFQETKIPKSSIEEWMIFIPDYTSYFSFPKGQLQNSGYSGVASYCRESFGTRPISCDTSFFAFKSEIFGSMNFDEDDELVFYSERWPNIVEQHDSLPVQYSHSNLWKLADSEGRCLVSKHLFIDEAYPEMKKYLYIFNLYCPRNDPERIERQHFQLRFYHMLEKRALELLEHSPQNHVIILGDFNTTHSSNDVYDDDQWNYKESYGRKWLQDLLNKRTLSNEPLFIDSFRYFNPEEKRSFTCWNTQLGCRITNFGSRLDYIVIDHKLLPHVRNCVHLNDFQGSDHCPVMIEFKSTIQPKYDSFHYSSHCSRSWPEFGYGSSQSSIKHFFMKRTNDFGTKVSFKAKAKKASGVSQASIQQFIKTFKKSKVLKINDADEQQEQQQPQECRESALQKLVGSSKYKSKETIISNSSSQNAWKAIFKQPDIPNCSGHNLPCVHRKSKKPGPNLGKEFFSCPKTAMEPKGHPETNCGFFRWIKR